MVLHFMRWAFYSFDGSDHFSEVQADISELIVPLLDALHLLLPVPRQADVKWSQVLLGYFLLRLQRMASELATSVDNQMILRCQATAMSLLFACDPDEATLLESIFSDLACCAKWVETMVDIASLPILKELDVDNMCKVLATTKLDSKSPMFCVFFEDGATVAQMRAGLQFLLLLKSARSPYLDTCNGGEPFSSGDFWVILTCLLVNTTEQIWEDAGCCRVLDALTEVLQQEQLRDGLPLDFQGCTKSLQNFQSVSALLQVVHHLRAAHPLAMSLA